MNAGLSRVFGGEHIFHDFLKCRYVQSRGLPRTSILLVKARSKRALRCKELTELDVSQHSFNRPAGSMKSRKAGMLFGSLY